MDCVRRSPGPRARGHGQLRERATHVLPPGGGGRCRAGVERVPDGPAHQPSDEGPVQLPPCPALQDPPCDDAPMRGNHRRPKRARFPEFSGPNSTPSHARFCAGPRRICSRRVSPDQAGQIGGGTECARIPPGECRAVRAGRGNRRADGSRPAGAVLRARSPRPCRPRCRDARPSPASRRHRR